MDVAYIGFGSNVGDRRHHILSALYCLASAAGIQLLAISSLYESEPVDGVNGGRFLNGVAKVSTSLEPAELLALLQSIETRLGRPSEDRSRPRTIDLDILLYGQRVIRRPDLIVPHPRMTQRSFVMFPLVEIEPSLHHPVEMKTVKDMVWAAGSRPALTRCDSVSLSEVEGREPRA